MKHIIILGDGMADHAVERLGGKTLLEYADKPMMDMLAHNGRTGRLITVPEGFPPGSEVANTAILGYDLNKVYEGRGPLEAASIGYDMQPDDFAIRCNIITLADGKIVTHNGGNLQTEDARVLIDYLNETLAAPINRTQGCNRVKADHLIYYEENLIRKIGVARFETLRMRAKSTKKWDNDELQKMIAHYTAEVHRLSSIKGVKANL